MTTDPASNREPAASIRGWVERDLFAAAQDGLLPKAFCVDDLVHDLFEILEAGRCPVLTGEPGVGKTAVVQELVRRLVAGGGPARLRNRPIWQISLQRKSSTVKFEHEVSAALAELLLAIAELPEKPLVFIRDLHFAGALNIEAQIAALTFALDGCLIGEGPAAAIEALLEWEPTLAQHLFIVKMEEPSVPACTRLLQSWSADQRERHGRDYSHESLDEAITLTRRFLARNRLPRKAIDLLAQVGTMVGSTRTITAADVIDRFCSFHRTPRVLLDPAMPLDLAALEDQFAADVLGQHEAVAAVVHMIGLVKAGLSDAQRPFGVFLFVGPTGVGKTHLAQRLAQYLFGSRERMIRLNMADFPDAGDADRLFGLAGDSRPTYARGILTSRLTGHPFAVLLLDEFEKSHAKVHDRFLQLFDEGQFINGLGESISCRSTIIIATSNAGAHVYRGGALGFMNVKSVEKLDREVDRLLEAQFRLELLNRFDHIVHFHPLSREEIRTIALRELERLKERTGLQRRRLTLEVDESVLDWLTAHGYDPEHGARLLRRTIERTVTAPLADVIVRRNPEPGSLLTLLVRGNRVAAEVCPPVAAPVVRETLVLPAGRDEQVKTLDPGGLLREARRIVDSADARLVALRGKRAERSTLIDAMNEPGFWSRTETRHATLDRFRELDVTVRAEERWAASINHLAAILAEPSAVVGARQVEAAARALHEWERRAAEEGGASVWLMISDLDPFAASSDWVSELTHMQLRWCHRLHLAASVAAFEASEAAPRRVALEIEGPGAEAYLAVESGLHRFGRRQQGDLRARIDLVRRSGNATDPKPIQLTTRTGREFMDIQPTCRHRMEVPARGIVVDLLGRDPATLAELAFDLQAFMRNDDLSQPPVARLYGVDGAGARDPRTGVSVPRLRDVMAGRLDPFLESWRKTERTSA